MLPICIKGNLGVDSRKSKYILNCTIHSTKNAVFCVVTIKDFFGKYDQIRSFLRIWSHLLKKSLMENLIFCAVISSLIEPLSLANDFR